MIRVIILAFAMVAGCGETKTSSSSQKSETQNTPAENRDSISPCMRHKIDSFKTLQPEAMPERVKQYLYKGNKVYYVAMHCCDFYNEVYDDKCKLMGAPDGGFTGRGDGKLPGFFNEATNEKLVWTKPQ